MSTLIPLVGCHSISLLFAHVVWATLDRDVSLRPEEDEQLVGLLRGATHRVRCRLLTAGVAPDHVHALVQCAPDVSLAEVVRRMKGSTSYALRHAGEPRFRGWQAGYWVESVSTDAIEATFRYVAEQRAHHSGEADPEPWQTAESSPPARRAWPATS